MSIWAIIGIFALGYISRHLAGRFYEKVFPRSISETVALDQKDVKDSVISHDRGNTWYIRTTKGAWVKVSYSTVQKILDFYVTNQPATDNQHPDAPSAEEG